MKALCYNRRLNTVSRQVDMYFGRQFGSIIFFKLGCVIGKSPRRFVATSNGHWTHCECFMILSQIKSTNLLPPASAQQEGNIWLEMSKTCLFFVVSTILDPSYSGNSHIFHCWTLDLKCFCTLHAATHIVWWNISLRKLSHLHTALVYIAKCLFELVY